MTIDFAPEEDDFEADEVRLATEDEPCEQGIILLDTMRNEAVNHPDHYGKGAYETINVIEAWGLNFCLGNAVKYISRAGKKDPSKELEDLEKAAWYIQRRIQELKGTKE